MWRKLTLKVPLMRTTEQDRLIWKHNNNGISIVKSGYRTYMDCVVDCLPMRVGGDWSMLWDIQVPLQVKMFVWRA